MDESLPSYGYYDESNIATGSSRLDSGPTLLDYLNFGGKTATGVLGALHQPKPAHGAAPKTNWAIIGAIAAAVLGVLLLLMVVSKK